MRLQAVEEFSELGSGFNIAMRDLDIRGAGAMLGAEQSGFIEDLGYETYHRILEEAVQELRHEEFSDLFAGEAAPPAGESTVDVEEDALIPGSYVSNNTERMNLYRRLADLGEPDELAAFRQELGDRFGPIPPEVDTLLMAAEIKTAAQALRLPRVQFKNQRLFLDVPSQDADPYFYETAFHPLLERLAAPRPAVRAQRDEGRPAPRHRAGRPRPPDGETPTGTATAPRSPRRLRSLTFRARPFTRSLRGA